MNFVFQPWQLLLIILAGWLTRQQEAAVEYLRTENLVFKEDHGRKRILLDDDQRRRLAVKGKILGRKALREIGTIVTHYHRERNHQGLGNHLIDGGEEVRCVKGDVRCRERLGGMLRYYYRDAA